MSDVVDLVSKTLFEDVAFNQDLEDWCAHRCHIFDEADEHKLDYTTLHEEFCKLFEAKITTILQNGGHSGIILTSSSFYFLCSLLKIVLSIS